MKAEGLLPDECPLSAIIVSVIIVGCEWNSGHQQYGHICETPILFKDPILNVPGSLNYWIPNNERQQRGFEQAIAQLPKLA